MKILLVEDDRLLAKGTAKLIERMSGYQVEVSDDPAIIFQLCEEGNIDLVIMDINLPGAKWQGKAVSGADLSRLLKNQSQTSEIPIIILTAYAMKTEREVLLEASHADELFTKPLKDFKQLIEAIDNLCKQSKNA